MRLFHTLVSFLSVCVLASSSAAQSGGSARLRPQHLIPGSGQHQAFGTALCAVTDQNGDGYEDWAVGVPADPGQGNRAGAVVVHSSLDGELVRRIEGPQAFTEFGSVLAPGADLDGDGRPEFLVGAPRARLEGPPAGAAWAYGAASVGALLSWTGSSPGEEFGASLAATGDVDGDGVRDILIGAPGHAGGGARAGAALLYSGRTGEELHRWIGTEAGARLGAAVSAAGDWDDDGTPDVALGAPRATASAGRCGVVLIRSGADGSLLHRLEGKTAGGSFGGCLAFLPEPELLAVAAPEAGVGGEVRLFERDTAVHFWTSMVEGSELGRAMHPTVDLDGNGAPELLLGAPGAEGRGEVRVVDSGSGTVIARRRARADGGRFGAALGSLPWVSGLNGMILGIASPAASAEGRGSGQIETFQSWLASESAVAAAAPATEGGEAPDRTPEPAQGDFLTDLAEQADWRRIEARDGRWILYGDIDPELLREAADLLDRFSGRLDDLLGEPMLEDAATVQGPVLLALLGSVDSVRRLTSEMASRWSHLGEWAEQSAPFPRLQHWAPLLAVVRHDASTAGVLRPTVQLAHDAVRLELGRRFGRLPHWVGEALGYALQDELVDGVYGYSYRRGELLDDSYHQGWKAEARRVMGEGHDLEELAFGSGEEFVQDRAYFQFAVMSWMLREHPEELLHWLRALAGERGAQPIDQSWEPGAAVAADLLRRILGSDLLARCADHWEESRIEGGAGARIGAVNAALASVVEEFGLDDSSTRGDRVRIWSDFRRTTVKGAERIVTDALARMDRCLGKPGRDEEVALMGVLLADRAAYHGLCDALAVADPALAGYLRESKQTTGFTLYDPLLTAAFHDRRVQEEARPDHDLAHSLVHLEVYRRFGPIPLWLSEGLACAAEEGATGEVWANWNREGFVYTVSHADWRRRTGRLYGDGEIDLDGLYGYSADPFDEELAYAAYGFVTYGLERDRKGFARLLEALREEYELHWSGVGRMKPVPATMRRLVKESFGEDFEEKIQAWWAGEPER